MTSSPLPRVAPRGADRVYYDNFTLIRLLAALQVLLVHAVNHFEYQAWFVGALKITPGVPAFFFTSGCLIYHAYDRFQTRDKTGFFINRFLRIYPALIVCVLVSVLSVYLTGYFHGRDIDVAHFVAWLLGQSTVFQFYNPPFMREYGIGVLNGALWTIAMEVQFYLLVPILYFLLTKRPRLLMAVFIASAAANVALNWTLLDRRNWELMPIKLLSVSFLPYLFMFVLGFYAASTDRVRDFVLRIDFKYLAIGYFLTMNVIGPYRVNATSAINPISFTVLSLMILKLSTVSLPIPAGPKRFLETTDLSYGLYLYHMPIINLLLVLALFGTVTNIAVVIVGAFVAALGSWHLIERPALSHKR